MFQLDLRSRKSIYEQVVDHLKELMITGVMKPEEKLPSVRDLSKDLTINPNTIQKAYRQLESLGYVYTVVGIGTFVSDLSQIRKDVREMDELKRRVRSDVLELLCLGVSPEEVLGMIQKIFNERGESK